MTFRLLPAAPAPVRTPAGPAGVPAARTRPVPELLLLVVVTLIGLGSVAWNATPPSPRPADAPASEFSATRAHALVRDIATAPRPVGSPAHGTVRDRLVAELTELGLRPEVLSSLGTDTTSGASLIAPVENVRATLPGTDPTGRVLLVAHYDSVDIGPGATDNGHAVAALLEIARALSSGAAPRNDVTFLFSDGEELGKVGAQAFADSAELGPLDRTVVLNLEARGTSGRTVMFETGDHNGALVPALGGHVPVTTSLADEVYRRLPNFTDFTVFREHGLTGMNFANVGTSANYDTPRDDLANSSPESLQDLGGTVLAATERLAAADIPAVQDGSEATYFNVAGLLVRYPGGLVLPLAGIAVLGYAAALWQGVRRRAVSGRSVALTAATVPVPLVGAAAVGWAGWQAIVLLRPHYTGFVFGDPYRPQLAALGLGVVGLAAVWAWAAALRRRHGAVELSAAVTGWLTLLALVTAALVPGASYIFVWPALAGVAGLVLAARLPETSRWRTSAAALASVPAAVVLLPVAALLFPALGLATAAVPLIVIALFAATVPAVFSGPGVRRRAVAARSLLAAATGVAVIAAGVARDGVDPAHPAPVSLVYVLDEDSGSARWASNGQGEHPWIEPYVDGGETAMEDAYPPLREPERWRTGAAPAATVAAPALKVLSSRRTEGGREVRVRLDAERGAPDELMLFADTTGTTVRGLSVAGKRLPGGDNRASLNGRWTWGFIYAAPPAGGVELTLRVKGQGPVRLRAVSRTAGFPDGVLPAPPRTVTWSAQDSGFTLVSRGFTI